VTDGSGNLVASYVYEGFGKVVGQSGGGGGPYQFCGLWGYRNDEDAGLMHVGARYYEVETGRWVQKDRWLGNLFYPKSLNYYVYCKNLPTIMIDLNGYYASIAIGVVIGIAEGILIEIGDSIIEHIDEHYEQGRPFYMLTVPCPCYKLPSWKEFLPETIFGVIGGTIGGIVGGGVGAIIGGFVGSMIGKAIQEFILE
jgi:RHS repeat-associated protein